MTKALLLDLSGVLYDGDRLLPGALEAVAHAREQGWLLRFVTNTATKSREQILDKLQALGFNVEAEELFTAPDAALRYVQARGMQPYTLVHPSIEAVFGVPPEAPDCVVLGDARDGLSYANLNRAFRLVKQGCPLIAIGDNKYFRDGDVLSLDAGPFVRAIAWAADAEPVVMGKPSAAFFAEVVNSTGLAPENCLMIGDDVFGDVDGALQAGLEARLVKTGKYQPGDETRLSPPAQTLTSIADLETLL
ncbi:TIGR01458 family HAD-type hydrolase [Marinimicrobium alkaliphilum]|uniref:TIGR01458 family HAD-type hydrolase n=1 Tax=Marinimicrobium alkaliphilum TaxID=2202654 RepID=UPI000DB8FD5E|nr:TIGR01458 family HAD-type hydrolase [Marinimicrobium alkaliphilum]